MAIRKGAKDPRAPDTLSSQVFEQYRPELRRFLRSRSHRAQAADDLAQEVYLRILRFPASEVIRQPQAYLYRIASNVVHDFNLRTQQEQVTYDSKAVDALAERVADVSEENFAERLEIQQGLERVLARLPPAWAAALILRKRDGLSYMEIGKEMNVSVHTVKKYIARAVAFCRTAEWNREDMSEGL